MLERELIQRIAKRTHTANSNLIKGIGDDCSVIRCNAKENTLLTTDMLVEGVHFDLNYHSPYLLGRKSMAVNISDIAAMGGEPHYALLSIGYPGHYSSTAWMDAFIDGVNSMLKAYSCTLIGGDTVSSSSLILSVTILGASPDGKAVMRNNAAVGDRVYVSGFLGDAAAGLYLCQKHGYTIDNLGESSYPALLSKHLDPEPQVRLGCLLRESGMVTAMQDISDGIGTDMSHICSASEVGACLVETSLPVSPALRDMCRTNSLSPSSFQIGGGEDYELLFTIRKDDCQRLESLVKKELDMQIYNVGVVDEDVGLRLKLPTGEHVNIDYTGYQHAPASR